MIESDQNPLPQYAGSDALGSFPDAPVGIWLGVQAAVHQNGLIDQAARIFSIIGTSFPTFVFGLLVLMIFYANLQWFPPAKCRIGSAR